LTTNTRGAGRSVVLLDEVLSDIDAGWSK